MNRCLFLALFLVVAFQFDGRVVAQEAVPRGDENGRASIAGGEGKRELRDLPYVANGHERQRLDLFLPPDTGSPKPLLVWVHGGAWQGGSKARCPAKEMVNRGYAVASVGYRLSQHAIFPAQIEDCKAAIRWLRAHAREYGIDSNRIGVWGESAGGHLVALLGTTGHLRDFDVGEYLDQSSRVQCVIDWYGPTDFLHYGEPPWVGLDRPGSAVVNLLGGRVSEDAERARRASPVYFVKSDAAPFLIMQGDVDELVPLQQSEILHAALQKVGVESYLQVFKGAGHGGRVFGSAESVKRMIDFVNKHLLNAEMVKR